MDVVLYIDCIIHVYIFLAFVTHFRLFSPINVLINIAEESKTIRWYVRSYETCPRHVPRSWRGHELLRMHGYVPAPLMTVVLLAIHDLKRR